MRIPSALLAGLGSAAIIGVGWQAGLVDTAQTTTSAAAGATSSSPTGSASSSAASSGAADTTAASSDGDWAGSLVSTRFGTVQVHAVISNGRITDVVATKLTDDGRKSVQISARAAPILRDEVLASQSATVSNVSGATYTTRGYLTSLQAALDQAGF